jgi:PKD repeat protein
VNIPRIPFSVPEFRHLSRRTLIIIAVVIAIFLIVPLLWFYILPHTGIIPMDLEFRGRTAAIQTMHINSTGTVLSMPLVQPLTADYYAVQVHPDDPATLQFLDLSRGNPRSWFWDFGDGANATDRYPVHHFGTFKDNTTVTLRVTRGDGAKSSLSKKDFLAAVSRKPVDILLDTTRIGTVLKGSSISFRVNDSSGSIIVNGNSIVLPYGALVTLRVNHDSDGSVATRNGQLLDFAFPDVTVFIDGKQVSRGPVGRVSMKDPSWLSTDLSFMVRPASGDIRQFVVEGSLLSAGEHNAYIRIRNLDLSPGSDLTIETIPAYFEGSALAYQIGRDVIADFDPVKPLSGSAPFNVTFSDRSAGSPTSWKWDFGDGTTSSEQNPRHIYIEPGSYTVKLTAITGDIADIEKKEHLIVVTIPRVRADFSARPVSGPAPLAVAFTDLSTGSPTFWQWDFGDNSTSSVSTERSPVHVYENRGVYSVWHSVGNIYGSSDLFRQRYIIVGDPFRSPDNTVFLRAGRGGYIEQGSTVQFYVSGSPATIYTGGTTYELPVGSKVRFVVTTPQYGTISITGGKLVKFDMTDIALYINDKYIRTGRIDSVYIPGLDRFQTSLTYYMPPETAWTLYTENGYDLLTDLENRWIRVSNVGMNANGLLSLIATKNSTYLDGAASMTEHDWIIG